MAKSTGQVRSEVIARMRGALKEGLSASTFINKMRVAGLSYRRQTMLADWRSAGNIQAKEGRLRYVRKGYTPSPALYAEVSWQTSREYMYKARVQTQLRPGDKPVERFVNIMSDNPMTIGALEREVMLRWEGWYPDKRELITGITIETGIRRV